jgi:L-alanine-DL-glutamate epimerase-like enolase superfamily enzyme
LVEICLWDLAAQAADQPLWQLLHGAGDRDLPVLLADGYPMPDESAEELVERLEQRVADGYTMLKIVAWPDPEEMRRMLRRLRDTIGPGPRLIVDAAWLFEDVSEALRYVAGWDELDVSWLEDAFLPHRAQDIRELHGASLVPIGIGDEATSESEMEILLREGSVDVLRLDATTLGGIAPAVRLAGCALDAGVTPSFHIYPEVHQHLAFSLPAPAHIEQMPRDRTFSLEHLFVQPTSVPHEGMVSPNDTPGTGLEIDWEFVSRHAVRTTASDASTVIR